MPALTREHKQQAICRRLVRVGGEIGIEGAGEPSVYSGTMVYCVRGGSPHSCLAGDHTGEERERTETGRAGREGMGGAPMGSASMQKGG